jgi:inner membrane transporter RhtA
VGLDTAHASSHPPAKKPTVTRRHAVAAMVLILVGATGVQTSAALSIGLFASLGPTGTSGARMLVAAVILLLVLRPRVLNRSWHDWGGIITYGVAIAFMNLFLYHAIDRIPLGVATTIDFLGPCVVALITSRRALEWLLAVLALIGVGLITGLGGSLNAAGIVFAALAGTFFGLYTFVAPRIGRSSGGVKDLALSVAVAAVILSPFGVPTLFEASGSQWATLAVIALTGTALPFLTDTFAGKISSAGMIGIFFAFDPVLGSIIGSLFLGQHLALSTVIGVSLVILSGAGIVLSASQRAPKSELVDPGEMLR